MLRENASMMHGDAEKLSLCMNSKDASSIQMTGQITDRIYKNGVLVDTIEGHNIIVNSYLSLATALLKGQSGYSGIGYWAVGSGSASWDGNTPEPAANSTRLQAEIGRVAISPSEMSFLDSNLAVSSTPTNILQIKHVFGTGDCNGIWREFGIFGGNATSASNSGIMINNKHHGIITKTSDMTIERTMRFTLNLV